MVDCTGDADVAYYAGAETLMEAGVLMPMTLGFTLTNIDQTQVRNAALRQVGTIFYTPSASQVQWQENSGNRTTVSLPSLQHYGHWGGQWLWQRQHLVVRYRAPSPKYAAPSTFTVGNGNFWTLGFYCVCFLHARAPLPVRNQTRSPSVTGVGGHVRLFLGGFSQKKAGDLPEMSPVSLS